MRISDWSSDVCSSDLEVFVVGEILRREQRFELEAHAEVRVRLPDGADAERAAVRGLLQRTGQRGIVRICAERYLELGRNIVITTAQPDPATGLARPQQVPDAENARASCRERGWQYV